LAFVINIVATEAILAASACEAHYTCFQIELFLVVTFVTLMVFEAVGALEQNVFYAVLFFAAFRK